MELNVARPLDLVRHGPGASHDIPRPATAPGTGVDPCATGHDRPQLPGPPGRSPVPCLA